MTIAEADRKTFAERFESIFALSRRVDGAVDKHRIDNKRVMAKYITTERLFTLVLVNLMKGGVLDCTVH